ncbi:MAG: selenocysteine-specific translation elongation factor [Phycisphaerales bacterium]|nr:selenocysteine-specific translation elongation factor [Phycisphaerales bacterium]
MSTRPLILGTAGHIDHGKTALVRALTGIDTDRLAEEKERGISIELGFAHLEIGGQRFGVVDVPGHERFIRNMLAGSCGIDLAVLVVAADDSVMPQTREHLEILRMLGVGAGVIVITKVDLAETAWVDLVEQEIGTLVAGSFLEEAPIVRTSATTGLGLEPLRAAIVAAAARVRRRRLDQPFRLCVDRSFTLAGRGTVVTGTVFSGVLRDGEEVERWPAGATVRVRGLHSHGVTCDTIAAGARAAINLQGVHHTALSRGDVLAAPGFLRPSRLLTVQLDLLEECPWPLRHRARVRLHIGAQEVMARVALLGRAQLEPGGRQHAQLFVAEPVASVNRQPFVLRAESPLRTIGGGVVLQPAPRRLRRRDTASIEQLPALASADDATRAGAAAFFFGPAPPDDAAWVRDADLDLGRVSAVRSALETDGTLVALGPPANRPVHRMYLENLSMQIIAGLRALHEQRPLDLAIPRQTLLSHLRYVDRPLVESGLAHLIRSRAVRSEPAGIALPDAAPALSAAQRRRHAEVIAAYETAAFRPPSPKQLAGDLGVDEAAVRELVALGTGQGVLVRLSPEIFLHTRWVEEMQRRLAEQVGAAGMSMSEVKDVLETTRKYAVPICEYLDRIGFTRREGDRRVLAHANVETSR